MKRFILLVLVLVLLFCVSSIDGIPISARDSRTTIGAFTGPRTGTAQDDNIKASLDLLHAKVSNAGTGSVFYVDSAVAGATGTNWAEALATLDAAVNLCSDNRGDVIYVAPGHAENITGAGTVTLDIAGLTIIGTGNGADRPTFTWTETASTIAVGDDSVTISGCRFLAGKSAVVSGFTVADAGDDFTMINCEFPEPTTSTYEFNRVFLLAASADGFHFYNNKVFSADAAETAVNVIDADTGAVTDLQVIGNYIYGEYTEGTIHSTAACKEVLIKDNIITNMTSTSHAIELTSTATGTIVNNIVCTDAHGTSIDPGSCENGGNMWIDYGAAEDVDGGPAWALASTSGSPLNYPENVETDSLFSFIMCAGTTATASTFNNTTDSLEAIGTDTDTLITSLTANDANAMLEILAHDTNSLASNVLTRADIKAHDSNNLTEIAAHDVNSQADLDALIVHNVDMNTLQTAWELDHLIAVADADDAADDSIIAKICSKIALADFTTYNNQTDSLQAIRDTIDGLTGIGFRGTVDAGSTATSVVCNDLAGFGNDYFNTNWSLYVVKDLAGSAGVPEGVTVDITDYATSTGTFTVLTTGTACATGDEIYILRTDELNLDDVAMLGGSGDIWYVDSGRTTGNGKGTTWENAFITVLLAVAGATTNNGDVIYVAAGHSEDVAGAYAINKAGLTFKGIGEADLQPTMVFTATGSQLDVTVADIVFENIKFESSIPDVVAGIDVTDGGNGFTLRKCRFVDDVAGTDEFLIAVNLQAGANDVTIEDCEFLTPGGAATEGIYLAGITDNLQLIGNHMNGDWTVSAIWSNSVNTNCLVKDNVIYQETNGQHAIEFFAAATGTLVGNRLYTDTYLSMLDPGSMMCIGNVGTDAIDQQSIAIPLSAETTDVTKVIDGSNLERLQYLQEELVLHDANMLADGVLIEAEIKATDTNSQADLDAIIVDFTNAGSLFATMPDVNCQALTNNTQDGTCDIGVATGDLYLEDILLSTEVFDLSGSAWAIFEISSDANHGSTGADEPIITEAVATFVANTTIGISEFDSELLPYLVEDGVTLYAHGSNAAGDVDGVVRVTLIWRRITDGATVTATDVGTIP